MRKINSFLICLLSFYRMISQTPSFGNEIPVTINGYTLDAMEPALSPDGNAMFFNSLNDGNTTSLYYAAKVNDSTFNLVGLVPVVNQSVTPRLDAVASLDSANNFFWVSTRDYPANMFNFHRVKFLTSSFTNFGRVYGNIYIMSPGWLIMDASINYQGDKLLYCNAWFNGCAFGMPCKAALGFAQKTNDSTFTKFTNSATLLGNINDTSNYIVYAPEMTKDQLELYYTRAVSGVAQTEICVAVRNNTNSAFGPPSIILPMSSDAYEGPTLSADKTKLYYHKKTPTGYKLFLRKKTGVITKLPEALSNKNFNVFPNPSGGKITVETDEEITTEVFNSLGEFLLRGGKRLDLTDLPDGLYFIHIAGKGGRIVKSVILSHP